MGGSLVHTALGTFHTPGRGPVSASFQALHRSGNQLLSSHPQGSETRSHVVFEAAKGRTFSSVVLEARGGALGEGGRG